MEPLAALGAALEDESVWVRLGAIGAAPRLAPGEARELIARQMENWRGSLDATEYAAAIVALEHAGTDAIPELEWLLGDPPNELDSIIRNGPQQWSDHLRTKVSGGILPSRAAYVLVPLCEEARRDRSKTAGGAPLSTAGRAQLALEELSNWQAPFDRTRVSSAGARPFEVPVKKLEAGDLAGAVPSLVEAALGASHPAIRFWAGRALAALGSIAVEPLFTALKREPGPRPDAATIASVSSFELRGVALRRPGSDEIAVQLASRALKDFTDPDAVNALLAGSVEWSADAQARAREVLASMSADVALPPLLWSAWNHSSAAVRSAAENLIGDIVDDTARSALDADIAGRKVHRDQLRWVRALAERDRNASGWSAEPEIAIPIIREAIGTVPVLLQGKYATASLAPTGSPSGPRLRYVFDLFGNPKPAIAAPRFPSLSAPASCRKGDEIDLAVRLLPKAEDGTLPPFDVPFASGADNTDILIFVYSRGFEILDLFRKIKVPRDGPSEIAHFRLRARDNGPWPIDVKFVVGTEIIGQCCAVIRVEDVPAASGDAATTVLDPVNAEALLKTGEARGILFVRTATDGHLTWQWLGSGGTPISLGASPGSFDTQQIDEWNAQQVALVRQILDAEYSEPDLRGVTATLASRGYELFKQLAPAPVADLINPLPDDALIVIESDADWVPWELLASKAGGTLWGERFVLVRAPLITKPHENAVAVGLSTRANLESVLLVIGDSIREGNIASRTFGTMAARATRLENGNWDALRAGANNKDIVHFTCHGEGSPYYLRFGDNAGRHFGMGQACLLGLKPGAVVFANACSSGKSDLLLSEFQSFGQDFYLAGARPFIGTLGPVPAADSIEFAGLFYRQFAFAGLPAGQALQRAKREARDKFRKPIWLFYCLYGNASVTRTWNVAT